MAKPYGLTDDHEPIDVINRQIYYSNSQNIVVAEDNISQLLTFRTEQMQEGIDLTSKKLYFDYISLNDGEVHSTPLQSPVIEEQDGEATGCILIEVPMLYEHTQKAGSLRFALSATEDVTTPEGGDSPVGTGDRQYVWQTKPSALTIQANLGKRPAVPSIENVSTGLEELITEIENLSSDLDAIQQSDIYNADAGDNYDGEVIFDGGDSTTEDEEG